MQLAQRIQKILDEQRLDQPALAKVAGVTKATVNQWLSGKIKSIKLDYAIQIQERYGYSPIWLVMGKGPEKVGDWPFTSVDRETFDNLPPELRTEIEHHLEYVVHKWEADRARADHSAA